MDCFPAQYPQLSLLVNDRTVGNTQRLDHIQCEPLGGQELRKRIYSSRFMIDKCTSNRGDCLQFGISWV